LKTTILIVDDHELFRDGLKALINLQSDMEVVGEATNGQESISLARRLQPDVILMDVKMPVMDGMEATRRILSEMPGMKILALSVYSGDGFNAGMMSAGALGYILKGGDFEEFVGTIRKVVHADAVDPFFSDLISSGNK
jgi:DNA-binding NarL/FixJ family response regulator